MKLRERVRLIRAGEIIPSSHRLGDQVSENETRGLAWNRARAQ
jgi:hypothetical protein